MTQDLIISTAKCALLSSSIFMMFKFSKGRQHYLEYVKSIAAGTAFGVAYSVYFNNEKLMNFVSREIAIQEYIDEKRRELNQPKK